MSLQRDPENLEGKTLHRFMDFKDKRILEVGCGEGRLTWKYAGVSSLTLGLDPDHPALRIARADCPPDLRERVHLTGASARHIPLANETFDIAVLAWSL
ncbi:MAG TPA: class I SAM-dependent methyltransferase [Anaerolineales bacterium]|nr:class I SAM-dependent methyltransferase [Anaerolineales bacterium]HNN13328.1 class I SAM-dependent methyltransferase [Anaerolineales bacterium]HNO30411.1 class I SAM-dependent methyltransferase [Anaerolineales bacterium]